MQYKTRAAYVKRYYQFQLRERVVPEPGPADELPERTTGTMVVPPLSLEDLLVDFDAPDEYDLPPPKRLASLIPGATARPRQIRVARQWVALRMFQFSPLDIPR